jgi:hypothetical protein
MATIRTPQRPAPVAAAAVLAVSLLAGLALADRGSAEAARVKASVLGQTAKTPRPTCPTPRSTAAPPEKSCQAMGRVTGFQISADGVRNPFKVRRPGMIVAWSVDVSKPSKKEQNFFETALSKSGPPRARLSILKRKEDGPYKLVKQSPVVKMRSSLGSRPVITLADPLRVRKGTIVALTTTSWLSNLADFGASDSDVWRASREEGQCTQEEDLLERSRPQQKVGGTRNYDCTYEGARLLYWAYLVPTS